MPVLKRSIIALLVALAVAGCTAQTGGSSVAPKPEGGADWRRDWLRGVPCAPPCFMGITPGTQTQTETLELMRADHPATLPRLNQKTGRSQGSIDWQIDAADPLSAASALFFETPVKEYDLPLNRIVTIRLGTSEVLSLGEVIEAYGDASHVLALAEPSAEARTVFWLSVVYMPQGFNLSIAFEYDGRQPVFQGRTMVERVHFFVPTSDGYDQGLGPLMGIPTPSDLLVPWEGFKEFAFYCREAPAPNNPDRPGCP